MLRRLLLRIVIITGGNIPIKAILTILCQDHGKVGVILDGASEQLIVYEKRLKHSVRRRVAKYFVLEANVISFVCVCVEVNVIS